MSGTAEATTGYWITENGEKACNLSPLRTATQILFLITHAVESIGLDRQPTDGDVLCAGVC